MGDLGKDVERQKESRYTKEGSENIDPERLDHGTNQVEYIDIYSQCSMSIYAKGRDSIRYGLRCSYMERALTIRI